MSSDEWKKANTTRYYVRFANSSGIPEAIERVCEENKTTPNEYIREAVLEKLDFDGYIHAEAVKQKRGQ